MRIVTEENQEFAEWDQNQQVNYVWEHYRGAYDFSYDVETFILTVQLRWVEEEGRMDLVGLEPEISWELVMGNWPVAFVQANYPLSADKKTYKDLDHPEQNPTGHSIRQYDGLLTVWYD